MWRTYVQGLLDYGSQVWCPIDPVLIAQLETTQRSFSVQTEGLQTLNYWDRLQAMKLLSVQRRMERYGIIYMWKVRDLQVDNPANIESKWSHKGRFVVLPKLPKNTLGKKLWENCFAVKAGCLFNAMPQFVRNHVGGDVNGFKTVLNTFLSVVPDQPRDAGSGYYPLVTDPTKHTPSNSLIHWRQYLEKMFPKYNWN